MRRIYKAALLISFSLFCGGARADSPHFKKIIWIVFENANYASALAQPDFAKLAERGALFQNFSGEAHPSQANYIAMISGSTWGVRDDGNVDLDQKHLGDLLEAAQLDWRVYADDYPGNCFKGSRNLGYARKHNPFISFTNVSANPERCKKIKSSAGFDLDLMNERLPDFSMYIPSLKNDGHDTSVDFAGRWLTSRFANLLAAPDGLKDTLLIVTFDESSSSKPNKIYTVLVGDSVKAGVKVPEPHNHVSLLKLVEDELQIGNLGSGDAQAPEITGIWK